MLWGLAVCGGVCMLGIVVIKGEIWAVDDCCAGCGGCVHRWDYNQLVGDNGDGGLIEVILKRWDEM